MTLKFTCYLINFAIIFSCKPRNIEQARLQNSTAIAAEINQSEALSMSILGDVCSVESTEQSSKTIKDKMQQFYKSKHAEYVKGGDRYINLESLSSFTWEQEFTEDPRALYLQDQRQQLQTEVRAQIIKNSQDIFLSIAPYDYQYKHTNLILPSSCQTLSDKSPASWTDILDRNIKLTLDKDKLHQVKAFWKNFSVDVLVMASLEALIVNEVYLSSDWNEGFLWPEGDAIKGEFPPIYPMSPVSTETIFPAEKIRDLYRKFPILNRPVNKTLGYPSGSILQAVVREAFSLGNQELNTWVKSQIRNRFEVALAEAKKIAIEETVDAATEKNKRLILAHSIFLSTQLYDLISTLTSAALESDRKRTKIQEMLQGGHDTWVGELQENMNVACYEAKGNIEELSSTTLSYFLKSDNKNKYGHLDAFCNSKWGQGLRKQLEAKAELYAGGAFVLGASFPPSAVVTVPLVSTLTATSFMSRALRKNQTLAVESSLNFLSINDQKLKKYEIAADLGMSLLALGATKYFTTSIHAQGGYKYFVPFTKYDTATKSLSLLSARYNSISIILFGLARGLDAKARINRGINPLADVEFWQNTALSAINTLFFSKSLGASGKTAMLKSVGVGTAVSLAMTHYVQNAYFLAIGRKINYEILRVDTLWAGSIGVPKRILMLQAYNLMYFVVEKIRGPSWVGIVASTALTIGSATALTSLYWPTRLEVTENGRGFFEYLYSSAKSLADRRDSFEFKSDAELKSLIQEQGISIPQNFAKEDLFGFDKRAYRRVKWENIQSFLNLALDENQPGLDILTKVYENMLDEA